VSAPAPRPLGRNQLAMLEAFRRHGSWTPGSGWVWDSVSEHVRLCESLERRGLVERFERTRLLPRGKRTVTGFRLTEAGEAWEQPS